MGSSIIKFTILFFVLSIAQKGNTQNVFNKAFDVNNAPNLSSNVLEAQNGYIFTQRADYNGFSHIQAYKLDTLGNFIDSNSIAQSTNALFYGYSGSLQKLSTNEYCQLYKIGPDNALRLVFFNENLDIIHDEEFNLGLFSAPGSINQINDSTILILGQVTNPTYWDLVLINTDLQGNERWRTTFGDPDKNDYGFSIEYLNNKIIVGGQTYNTSQIAHPHLYEFNNSGLLLFDTAYTQFDNGGFLTSHQNYGLYLTGIKYYSNNRQPYLISINTDFSINWSKNYFSNDTAVTTSRIVINYDGIITMIGTKLINGEFSGLFFQTNAQGDSLGSKIIDHLPNELAAFNDIRSTSDGGYIMAGETRAPSQDSWIVKVNEWGCDNIPCIVSVAEQPKNDKGELICYPNPSNGFGTLKGSFKNAGSNNDIKVFNSLGQLVFSKSITNREFEMEVSLPISGLYLVNMYQGGVLVESLKWVVN